MNKDRWFIKYPVAHWSGQTFWGGFFRSAIPEHSSLQWNFGRNASVGHCEPRAKKMPSSGRRTHRRPPDERTGMRKLWARAFDAITSNLSGPGRVHSSPGPFYWSVTTRSFHCSCFQIVSKPIWNERDRREKGSAIQRKSNHFLPLVLASSEFERTSDPSVGGSNPSGRAKLFDNLRPNPAPVSGGTSLLARQS